MKLIILLIVSFLLITSGCLGELPKENEYNIFYHDIYPQAKEYCKNLGYGIFGFNNYKLGKPYGCTDNNGTLIYLRYDYDNNRIMEK